eukprot:CAMPEP_0171696702 /NCGR_PEP_ID=MMETSP0991-20121206/8429_1 /TAXON_ID=483369 /ORGANISM="non described non described, Strain CCMP2098" /LENGTH=431 /DNA_ID=CAMNT_0012285447 /DNA_START=230 /DNA_END=1526 /DNA_ORIENTATION=-
MDAKATAIASLALGVAVAAVVHAQYKKKPRGTISDLVRANIASLEPYRCARDDYSDGVLLDANENSIGATVAEPDTMELNRYPDPYQKELKEMIAKYRGVRWEQIFLGVGSDEAIDIIMRIFCVPGTDSILITPPTYGMYSVSAKTNDVGIIKVPLTPEFDVEVEKVPRVRFLPPLLVISVSNSIHIFTHSFSDERWSNLIFLVPHLLRYTGSGRGDLAHQDHLPLLAGQPDRESDPDSVVEAVASKFNGIVVVDEAYIDFCTSTPSACCLVDKHRNIVVMQTLSKAFGLAGVRLGMAIANAEVIHYFNTMKAPYNVSKLASKMGKGAFEHVALMESNVALILQERARVAHALSALPFVKRVCRSDANFLLFELPNAKAVYKTMADSGVVCRFRGSEINCKDCLRVTIGTPSENDQFLALLESTAKSALAL